MKVLRRALLLFSIIIIAVSCSKNSAKIDRVNLQLDGLSVDDSPLFLYAFFAEEIRVDTIAISPKGKIKYAEQLPLDSIDIVILVDSKGRLILPLIPSRAKEGIKASVKGGKALSISGVVDADSIQKWYALKDQGLGVLLPFIERQKSEPLTTLLTLDAMRRDSTEMCISELSNALSRAGYYMREWRSIIGIGATYNAFWQDLEGISAPHYISVKGEKERKDVSELLGNRPLFAINIFEVVEDDSAQMSGYKRYLETIDSLNIPSYNLLLNDTLPVGFSTKTKGTWRYFLLDEVGEVQQFISDRQIPSLPCYVLVDSTLEVWRNWSVADSLIQFIEDYNRKKEVRVE